MSCPVQDYGGSFVGPLLTDLYQLSMAYAYWNGGTHEEHAVFDLYFRKYRTFQSEACATHLLEALSTSTCFLTYDYVFHLMCTENLKRLTGRSSFLLGCPNA